MPATDQNIAQPVSTGWVGGMRSDVDPLLLQPTNYRSGMNMACSRGVIRARKPMRALMRVQSGHPQALVAWEASDGTRYLVAVVGGIVFASRDPFSYWYRVPGYEFRADARQVFAEGAVKNAQTQSSGAIVTGFQKNLLFLSDGFKPVAVFDGMSLSPVFPGPPFYGPPIGTTVMRWSGRRMWFCRGNELHASNYGEPDKLTEAANLAGGGFIPFRHQLTGLMDLTGKTGLMVFTPTETHIVRSEIADRNAWQTTPDFTYRLFAGLGCVAPKSTLSHFGQPHWYSAGGLISLNEAQRTYRDSFFQPLDQPMRENSGRLSGDRSQVCTGALANILLVSAPAGDIWNRETWAWDLDPGGGRPAWMGAMVGVLPVEWASVTTTGQPRTFCLAKPDNATDGAILWEFEPTGGGRGSWGDAEWPLCQFETGLFAAQGDITPRSLGHVTVELFEVAGPVAVRIYVAPARSRVYRRICERTVRAGDGVLVPNPAPNETDQPLRMVNQRRQARAIVSEEFRPSQDDMALIDAPDFRGDPNAHATKDRGFTVLVEWRGDCAIRLVQMTLRADPTQSRGVVSADEPSSNSEEQGRICPTYVETVPDNRMPDYVSPSNTNPNPPT